MQILRHFIPAVVAHGLRLAVLGGWLASFGVAPAVAGNDSAPACGRPIPELERVLPPAAPLPIYQACFVNAVRFAEGFRQIAPAERAEIVRVSVRLPESNGFGRDSFRTEAHAVVAFTFAQRNFLWDQSLGIFEGPAGDIAQPGYAQAAERALQERFLDCAKAVARCRCPLPDAPEKPKSEAEKHAALQWLLSQLPPAVPAFRVAARLADDRTVEGAAIIFDQYFGVYVPDRGTLLAAGTDGQWLKIAEPSAYVREAIAENYPAQILDLQITRVMPTNLDVGKTGNLCC